MTEYELKSLPWKAYRLFQVYSESDNELEPAGKSDDGVIYCYRSDNPNLVELRVMVKNHRVLSATGGNG